MSKPAKSDSLAALASSVQTNADKLASSWRGEQLAGQLRSRRDHLNTLIERVEKLAGHRAAVVAADPKARVGKRRLTPAINKLEKLESAVAVDIAKVVEPGALDYDNLAEALKEVEQALLETWQKFSKPPKDIPTADALADVPELKETVDKLRTTRGQLETHGEQLPVSIKDVATVRTLQKHLRTLSDKLQTHGYDEEVLAFLGRARVLPRGASLADSLADPKVRKWLESGKNASAFVILHKSAVGGNSALHV